MAAEYYTETVLRYRVLRREIITDARRRAEYAINGMDPDDTWSLIWSFNNLADAEAQAAEEREIFGEDRWVVAVKDAGQTEHIKRMVW